MYERAPKKRDEIGGEPVDPDTVASVEDKQLISGLIARGAVVRRGTEEHPIQEIPSMNGGSNRPVKPPGPGIYDVGSIRKNKS